jgi:hypothetical protein
MNSSTGVGTNGIPAVLKRLLLAAVGLALAGASAWAQEAEAQGSERDWKVVSAAHVDLWYHGLAVIGFDQDEGFPLYNPDYVERVKAAKEEQGVYPTALDSIAEELLEDLEEDAAFQNFHFVPLYFPTADREGMLTALDAVATRRVGESTVGPDTRTGARWATGAFEEGSHRRVLRRFVQALEREWEMFYADFWEREVALGPVAWEFLEREWNEELAPPLEDFLGDQGLQQGYLLMSPVLGPEGRLIQGNAFRGIADAVAVWAPGWDDLDASLYSVVRELCFSIIDQNVINPATVRRGDPNVISGRAAVRCGSMLVYRGARDRLAEYQATFLRAAGVDSVEADTTEAFQEEFQVPARVEDAIRARLWPDEVAAQSVSDQPGWIIQTGEHVDLWYHGMAVISADQPGPLGMYSADYARRIREIKQERGLYPTKLDSIASDLRDAIRDDDVQVHFVPLYFENTGALSMLDALRAIARRRPGDTELVRPEARVGVFRLNPAFMEGRSRRFLEEFVDALENEWEVFYSEYWEELTAQEEGRYDAMQSIWDSLFVPALGSYLERKRLSSGSVFPSPALRIRTTRWLPFKCRCPRKQRSRACSRFSRSSASCSSIRRTLE